MRAWPARLRLTLMAGCAALALAACTGDDGPGPLSKSMTLSPKTLALMQEKQMAPTSPVVVRIYKEESELEVWKETTSGEYALLKTYPICRWSGELGPKVKEGDRQAPEGFYTITPGQMNPNSQYYLAFDLGFPNAYDKALGRYGSNLMVHGDCSSRGCYAMTDEQIQELFVLGRESFKGGQRSFQVQAYPFRMTADNMVRHRNNPNLAFWKMLKEGSDTFELTKAPPKVDYCGKKYVFNATPTDPTQKFQAALPCPDYTLPEGLGEEIAARQQEVATKIASADASVPVAPVKTGKDGGMHKVFLAKLQNPELKAPGSLPPVVKPPGSTEGVATNEPAPEETVALAQADVVPTLANVPLPAPRPADAPAATAVAASEAPSLFGARTPAATAPGTQVAALDGGGGFLDSVKSLFGGSAAAPAAPSAPASSAAPAPSATAPAPATPAPVAPAAAAATVPAAAATSAPASSGFSLTSLFSGLSLSKPEPAPAATEAPADVPMPPVRPPVPQASARPAAAPAAHNAARPAATPVAAPAAATAAPAAPSYATVPTPAAASETPVLRPSVAASDSTGAALPGATILTPGSFSSSAQ
ncbi:murein L,D-transpeptidase [Ancylobacter sp. WKF20]|uniref:murein L,D-transpeptidase n=1 Tax=Ancylobacter sp. WKF20 TaxID=3039801 RepID=UPI002434518C|nr:murein L,D-transpeptidase [Ancylobacter sp. WKF20]WGD28504.1 murein L,D-transpeptidase [Ancylobacter sp. WKF20]